jgi:hypothetical protein
LRLGTVGLVGLHVDAEGGVQPLFPIVAPSLKPRSPGQRPSHLPSPAQRAGYPSAPMHNRANGPAVCATAQSQTYRSSISMPCFSQNARYSSWNDLVA